MNKTNSLLNLGNNLKLMRKLSSIGLLLTLSLYPTRSEAQLVITPQPYISSSGTAIGPIKCATNGLVGAPCFTGLDTTSGFFFATNLVEVSVAGTLRYAFDS